MVRACAQEVPCIRLTENIKNISFTLNVSRFLVTPFSFASCLDPLVTRDDSGTEKSSYLQNLQNHFMGCHLIKFSPTQNGILSG